MSLSGILNVNKPVGMTSHDVVSFVRRLTGLRRVGHAGTLDPAASGVLLLCLGQATRLSEYLMRGSKRYHAVIHFGAISTTDDAAGTITPTGSVLDDLTYDRFLAATRSFIGEIEQVPPSVAAIKVRGERLYRRARAGSPLHVPARLVRIDTIDVQSWSCPELTIDVTCSKGTYIRALARDLGEVMGTGAYLQSLVRLASGRFSIDDSLSLAEITRAATRHYLDRVLYPLDAAVADWPAVFLTSDDVTTIRNGKPWCGMSAAENEGARLYDARTGHLVALARYDSRAGWLPEKVFSDFTLEEAHDGA